ncbi:MAG TPA: pitrilysin family protein [Candidatus Polarisedimenticolaceae bacterium]|nr:pitrilysin family protein [Candidatus Polarisedimenticolaceae bacterium]
MTCYPRARLLGGVALLIIATQPLVLAASSLGDEIVIPYERFVLDNGLTLIVHEDHKAPIVAVNVWYHVGSKNEPDGRSGFAHLFEHLMFNGSEHYNDDYFQVMERLGSTDLNGTTNEDRTNYFQNVPTSALDTVLWLESDRMGHLLGAVDQERLDEQRGVVQNEKRQGDNQPYAKFWEMMTHATYPEGHPYSHTVIGSLDDLDAAELDDVKEWFQTYYGAANAVVVVAGDVDAETAKSRVEHYFGDIPAGPPIGKFDAWVAQMEGTRRQSAYDRVPQARLYKVWNVPPFGSDDQIFLQIASSVLASGKTSRLYNRLVYRDQIATDVSSFIDDREIGSQFHVWATAKPGQDLTDVERAVDEELRRFVRDGPSEAEVERARTETIAGYIRGLERIGGFGGKSDVLAQMEVFLGDAGAYRAYLDTMRNANAAKIKAAVQRWLDDGVYIFEMHPFPDFKTAENGADRSKLPEPGTPPAAKFPEIEQVTLSNGVTVLLAERHAIPVVDVTLLVDAGYAADQFAIPGTASLTLNMLDEGTQSKDALEISEAEQTLGAEIDTGSGLDTSFVGLTAMKANLDASLALFADVVLNPSFPAQELERLKKMQIAGIQREKSTPIQMALRIFPKLMYGDGHAYGNPFTGSGDIDGVTKMTRDDLIEFHQTWFKPNNSTIIVVGDTTIEEMTPKLESLFKRWKASDVPQKNIGAVTLKEKQTIYVIDRPGSPQSVILAGHVSPPKNNPDEIAIESMNQVLGGTFTSRVNMNLREDKHWSYGSRTIIVDAKGQRPFIAFAPVQSDKTAESMQELAKELSEILDDRPIEQGELDKVQANRILRLPGSWETSGEVASAIREIVEFGLPLDYYNSFAAEVRALQLADVQQAAERVVKPDGVTWVVVGDRSQIEQAIRGLGWADVKLLDADGNPVN